MREINKIQKVSELEGEISMLEWVSSYVEKLDVSEKTFKELTEKIEE